MKMNNIVKSSAGLVLAISLAAGGCQKMDRPALGDFPRDANTPGGPLKFYAAFDGTTADPLMNGVDSIRANFPSDNPLGSVAGVRGRGIKGESKKFVKYARPNDWLSTAASFTVSIWFKKNGATTNNLGAGGPEHIISTRAVDKYNWSNGSMSLFLEGTNAACAVKYYIQAGNNRDKWFTWEGGNTIAGLLDNNWHHLAAVYNQTNSTMTLYIDGRANPNTVTFDNQGGIKFDASKVAEFRVGRGPRNDGDDDGAGGWLQSSFKGDLDQLRLYSEALTPAQVQTLFSGRM